MWIARIKYKHEDCVTMPKIVKHNIVAYATPGNSFTEKGTIYSTGFLMLSGEEKNKKSFIRDLKRDKRVSKVEVNNDLVIMIEKHPLSTPEYSAFRSKEIMTVRPVYCNPQDGFEYWEICSWDKKHLNKFITEIENLGEAKLLSLQRMRLQDVYQFHISPKLTSKQRQALDIALKQGYYKVPRKVDIGDLAKFMKISRQAFSEHLRKAEMKLMPVLSKDFLN